MGEIENDLSNATVAPSRYGTALTTAAMAAVGMMPGVGGAIQTIAQGTLAQRQAERDADFAMRVARRLQALENRPTTDEVLDSDEFIAAWTKAERVAAETADSAKRERLARVLARTGPWAPYDPEDRAILLDLVTRYNEEHIALLDFFRDPSEAIRRTDPRWQPNVVGGAPVTLVKQYLYPDNPAAVARVGRVAGDLQRDGTADIPLNAMMTGNGVLQKQTSALGDRLLDSLAD